MMMFCMMLHFSLSLVYLLIVALMYVSGVDISAHITSVTAAIIFISPSLVLILCLLIFIGFG